MVHQVLRSGMSLFSSETLQPLLGLGVITCRLDNAYICTYRHAPTSMQINTDSILYVTDSRKAYESSLFSLEVRRFKPSEHLSFASCLTWSRSPKVVMSFGGKIEIYSPVYWVSFSMGKLTFSVLDHKLRREVSPLSCNSDIGNI